MRIIMSEKIDWDIVKWIGGVAATFGAYLMGLRGKKIINKKTETEGRLLTAEEKRNEFNDLEAAWDKIAVLKETVDSLMEELRRAKALIERLQASQTINDTYLKYTRDKKP